MVEKFKLPIYMKLMDYGINGLNGLTIALEYLKYVVSSSQLFSRDLAILENPLYVYSIYPFMARALLYLWYFPYILL